jgi:preprotein translocase subunit SecG
VAIFSNIILFFAIVAAIVFSLLVLLTGKGDAMSGGGSVRTNYKGKATFDDIMSKAALYLGVSFMALVLLYNVVSKRVLNAAMAPTPSPVTRSTPPATNTPPAANNAPKASNTPGTANNSPAASNTPSAATNTPASTPPASNNATPGTITPADNNAPKK